MRFLIMRWLPAAAIVALLAGGSITQAEDSPKELKQLDKLEGYDSLPQEKSVKGGSLIRVGEHLVVLSEKGELIVCDASSSGFRPVLRSQVLDKRCWVQPTFDAGRLFVKNNDGDLAAFELK